MSKIAMAFDHGKAFIAFITCGDSDLETTATCVRAAVRGGADLIELGIPFSDPTAEGPVIQAANERALKGGVTTDKIFELVQELRRDVTVPMVFMTYANVVYSYGIERFCDKCVAAGIDGIIPHGGGFLPCQSSLAGMKGILFDRITDHSLSAVPGLPFSERGPGETALWAPKSGFPGICNFLGFLPERLVRTARSRYNNRDAERRKKAVTGRMK